MDETVKELLKHVREPGPVSDVVRARAVWRARASLATLSLEDRGPQPPPRAWRRSPRVAVATALFLLLGVAGAAGAVTAMKRGARTPFAARQNR